MNDFLADDPGRLKVVYTPIVDDYVEFSVNATKRLRSQRRFLRNLALWTIIGLLLVVGYDMLVPMQDAGPMSSPQLAKTLGMLGAFVAVILVVIRLSARRHARRRFLDGTNRALLLPKNFEASRDGLGWSDELTLWNVRWPAIHDVVVTDKAVYLYSSSLAGCFVPRHAFPDDAAFRGCAGQLQRWFEAAGKSQAL